MRSSSGTASKHQYKLYHMEEHDPTVRISASLWGRGIRGMMDSVGHVTASAKLKAAGLMDRVSLLLLLTPASPLLHFPF